MTDSPNQPFFTAVARDDSEIQAAHGAAASTVSRFGELVQKGGRQLFSAKLRFRDPDLSEARREDSFLYLWLHVESFDKQRDRFLGTFFEVPPEFAKWHKVGEQLYFDSADVFDWMVNDDGVVLGGYSLRVYRSRLPEDQRNDFDEHTGVTTWEPLPRSDALGLPACRPTTQCS